jgi:type VI secretion system secreted protein VgrG
MIQDPVKRSRVKRTLLIIIIATIPCYLLGGVVLLVNEGIRGRVTPSAPTATFAATAPEFSATPSPTLPVPTVIFPTRTDTPTPTITLTLTLTRTYVIPTSTPSHTPTSTDTAIPPTETSTSPPEETP